MEYVCTGATLKCTMGTSCPKLKATPKNVSLTEKDQANIADYVSMKNVPSFGRCRSLGYPPTASATAANHGKLTPMPCVPGTCPKWKAIDKDSLICGEPALLKPSTLKCMYGGTISIVDPGQKLEIKCASTLNNSFQSVNSNRNIHQIEQPQKNENLRNDLIGTATGGAASIDPIYPSETQFLDNDAVFEHVLLDVLNPMINGNNSNVADTIERTARRYTSANLRNILNSISIAIDISSTEIIIIKNGRYNSTFGDTTIELDPIEKVGNNKYQVKYTLDNVSNYISLYRDDTEVGVLVKALPKGKRPTESMFRDTKDVKWFPLKNPNDENVIISMELEDNKDYYAIVYIEALYKRNYLFSNMRKI